MNETMRKTMLPLIAAAVLTGGVATRAATSLPVTGDLILWLDATDLDGDGVSEGNAESGLSFSGGQHYVQNWVDKSGAGHNATNLPTLAPVTALGVGPNGGNVVRFAYDGADDRMQIANFTHGGDMTYFAIFKADVVNSNDQIFNSNGSPTGGAYVVQVASNLLTGRVFKAVNTGQVDTAVSSNTNYLATYTFANNTTNGAELLVNGLTKGTATTIDIPSTTSTAYVGNHPTGASGFDGDMTALVVYDRKLSAGEENKVGYALERRYGLDTAYHQNAININFSLATNDNNAVDSDERSGVAVAADGNLWNHVLTRATSTSGNADLFVTNTTGGNKITLKDSFGNSNAASLTSSFAAGGGFSNFSNVSGAGVGATGDAGMMQSYLNFGGSVAGETITISGLDNVFTSRGYDVYVYFEGNLSRTYGFTIDGKTIWGSDALDNSDTNDDGTIEWKEGVGTSSGTANSANYVVFHDIYLDSFTLSALSGGSYRAIVNGLQIVVNVPAPAALPAGLALLGLAAVRRRRRTA